MDSQAGVSWGYCDTEKQSWTLALSGQNCVNDWMSSMFSCNYVRSPQLILACNMCCPISPTWGDGAFFCYPLVSQLPHYWGNCDTPMLSKKTHNALVHGVYVAVPHASINKFKLRLSIKWQVLWSYGHIFLLRYETQFSQMPKSIEYLLYFKVQSALES